ncbi:MAG: hypothetical protein JKY54_12620 [Flavobacteriales bacterium]|nr:hypothetical protein [Flavobacteriales bacterium]
MILMLNNVTFGQVVQSKEEIEKFKELSIKKVIELKRNFHGKRTQEDTSFVAYYNKNGQLIYKNNYPNQRYHSTSKYTYKKNLAVEASKYYASTNSEIKILWLYDKHGNRINRQVLDTNGTLQYGCFFDFDANGNEVSTRSYDKNEKVSYETYYKFNSSGHWHYMALKINPDDTSRREYKIWDGNLLLEHREIRGDTTRNKLHLNEYNELGQKVTSSTHQARYKNYFQYFYDDNNNEILNITYIIYDKGDRGSTQMIQTNYNENNLVVRQTEYSNEGGYYQSNSLYYTWRNGVLVREEHFGPENRRSYIYHTSFPSMNLKMSYQVDAKDNIVFVEEGHFNMAGRLIRTRTHEPDYVLKDILDLKPASNFISETLVYYMDSNVMEYAKTDGWETINDGCELGRCDTIKVRKVGDTIMSTLRLSWGGTRYCYLVNNKLVKVEDYDQLGNKLYKYYQEKDKKYCMVLMDKKVYNSKDSLIAIHQRSGLSSSPRFLMTYQATYVDGVKMEEKHLSEGILIKRIHSTVMNDTIRESVYLPLEDRKYEVVKIFENSFLMKWYVHKPQNKIPGVEWNYRYDKEGQLTAKIRSIMDAIRETRYVYEYSD